METNYNGFLFTVAYKHFLISDPPKEKISLCRYFWAIIGGAIVWIINGTVLLLLFTVGTVITFFFSYRVNWWNEKVPDNSCVEKKKMKTPFWIQYKHWPKFRGTRIYPILIILLVWTLYAFYSTWNLYRTLNPFELNAITNTLNFSTFWAAFCVFGICVIAVLIIIVLLSIGFSKMRKSEWSRVVKEYLKAKKAKVCPFITIIGAPPLAEADKSK